MLPTEEQIESFQRLAKNRDMKVVLAFYENLLAQNFSVNSVSSLKDLISAQKSMKFIQEEFIDRLKSYEDTRTSRLVQDEFY
jgi:hypothetical protein